MYSVLKKFIKKLYELPHKYSKKEKNIKNQTQTLPSQTGKVVWLIPDQSAYKTYAETIERFANRFNTPLFSPHFTFGSLPDLPVELLSSKLDTVLSGSESIVPEADFVRCSSSPYQNLVHQYKLNKQFKEISERTENVLPGFQAKDEIHISLMYGFIDCNKLEEKVDELEKSLPQKVLISEYQIIGLADRVEQWKTLYSKSF